MPKIFAIRHALAEQQSNLKQQVKGSGSPEATSSRAPSSDEEAAGKSTAASPGQQQQGQPAVEQLHLQPEAGGVPPGLDISPLRVTVTSQPATQHTEQNAPLQLVHNRHRHSSSGTVIPIPVILLVILFSYNSTSLSLATQNFDVTKKEAFVM